MLDGCPEGVGFITGSGLAITSLEVDDFISEAGGESVNVAAVDPD